MARINSIEGQALTSEEVEILLGMISGDDYDTWIKVAMAVNTELGDAGFHLWMNWSQTYRKDQSERSLLKKYNSFNKDGVSAGTLFHLAGPNSRQAMKEKATIVDDITRARMTQARQKRYEENLEMEASRKIERRRSADQITNQWDNAERLQGDADSHPYLVLKQVKAHGIRRGEFMMNNAEGKINTFSDALVIPLRDISNNIRSAQIIFEDRNGGFCKLYATGSLRAGCFHKIQGNDAVTIFCEGYATGASIHEATGYTVVCCMDTSGLKTIPRAWREMMPRKRFLIAGDDDKYTNDNPGLKAATLAAASSKARKCFPAFPDSAQGKLTDFNDLAVLCGYEEVSGQINAVALLGDESLVPLDEMVSSDLFKDLTSGNKPKPKDVVRNFSAMFKAYGIKISKNVIKKRVEISLPPHDVYNDSGERTEVHDVLNYSLRMAHDCCRNNELPTANIDSHIDMIASINSHNPVADYITSKPWDRVSRLDDLFETLRLKDGSNEEFSKYILRKWMLSAVAAAFKKSQFSTKGVLVLQGPQSAGKTSWVRSLLPMHMQTYLMTGHVLDPADKDNVINVIQHWIVELGEIDATFNKKDSGTIKNFISKTTDTVRMPYAKIPDEFPRRTVFVGTVNEDEYLRDPTGSSRFWTIPVESLDYMHDMDMQQMWAEVYHWFKCDEKWYFTPEDEKRLKQVNSDFEEEDPLKSRIYAAYKWADEDKSNWNYLTTGDVLSHIGESVSNKGLSNRVGKLLREMTGMISPVKKKKGKCYLLPPAITNMERDVVRNFENTR